MKKLNVLFFLISTLFLGSCSNELRISSGARDNKPLVFNNEYKTEDLSEVVVDGSAFWGIPSFTKNNQNNRKNGFLFTFNGLSFGKTKRVLPILTMVGYSIFSARLVQIIGGEKEKDYDPSYYGYFNDQSNNPEYKLQFLPAWLIGLPIAGTLNNLTWRGAAYSGATSTLNYELVQKNPNVDVFCYPKYEITTRNGLWTQKATIKARVTGATLIHK